MSDFVLLYRFTPESRREAMDSPERAQEAMRKWRAWFDDMTSRAQLKSPGQPLEDPGRVVRGPKRTVTDGPYAETKELVGGYSVIEARDLDHAAQIAAGCPILDGGGSVEIRPVRQMNL